MECKGMKKERRMKGKKRQEGDIEEGEIEKKRKVEERGEGKTKEEKIGKEYFSEVKRKEDIERESYEDTGM